MIRFIFVVLFVVLFLILSTPLMLVEWIIGKFNPGLKDKSSLSIVNWAFRQVIRLAGPQWLDMTPPALVSSISLKIPRLSR